MKRVFIALALLVLMAVCCKAALDHFEDTADELIAHAEEMASAVKARDGGRAAQSLRRLDGLWQREKSFFHILSGSDNCEQLEEALGRIKVWSAQKEKSPELLSELSDLIINAEHLLQTQSPGLMNLL